MSPHLGASGDPTLLPASARAPQDWTRSQNYPQKTCFCFVKEPEATSHSHPPVHSGMGVSGTSSLRIVPGQGCLIWTPPGPQSPGQSLCVECQEAALLAPALALFVPEKCSAWPLAFCLCSPTPTIHPSPRSCSGDHLGTGTWSPESLTALPGTCPTHS